MGWFVSQVGAREHYAVARGLARYSSLDRLYTDAWCRLSPRLVARLPGTLGRYAGRLEPELDDVKSFEARLGIGYAIDLVTRKAGQSNSHEIRCLNDARRFATLVRKDLNRSPLDPLRHAFFGYSTNSLESLVYVRGHGIPAILGQAACGKTDYEEIAIERSHWPRWEGGPPVLYEEYFARIHAEREASSAVIVNSRWARDSALKEGCLPEKLYVVPLAYEPKDRITVANPGGFGRRLRVMWLGQVILRKGIPYLLMAARLLPGVDFIVAGTIGVDYDLLRDFAPANVCIMGAVPRTRIDHFLKSADVFVLPTLSDGFALTQVEAMASGLPVITTDRCGEVVTHGVDGYVVPVRDVQALADAIDRFDNNRNKLRESSFHAREKAKNFSLKHYVENLGNVLHKVAPDTLIT